MCGSEPCRHDRDYTTTDAMKSYVAASALAGNAAIKRDAALAALAHIERLCTEALASEHRFRGEAFVHVSDLRNAAVLP